MEDIGTYSLTAILYTENKRYKELVQIFQQVKNLLNSYKFKIDNKEYSFEFDIVQTQIEDIFGDGLCDVKTKKLSKKALNKIEKTQNFIDFALVLGSFNNSKQKDDAIYNQRRIIEIDYSNYINGYDANNFINRQYVTIRNNRNSLVNFFRYPFSTFLDTYSPQEVGKLTAYAQVLELINKEIPNLFSGDIINYLLARLNFIINNNDSAAEYYEKYLNFSIQNNLYYSFSNYYSLLLKNNAYDRIINYFSKLSFKSIEDRLNNDFALAKVYDIVDSQKAIETYSNIIDKCLKINIKNKKPAFLNVITKMYSTAVIKKSKYFIGEEKRSQLKTAIDVLNEKFDFENSECDAVCVLNIFKEYKDNFNTINDLVYVYNVCQNKEEYYELKCEIYSLLINAIMELKPWKTINNYDYSYFIELSQKQMLVNDYFMNKKCFDDNRIKEQILNNGVITIVILVMANEISLANEYSLYINNYICKQPNKSATFWNRSKKYLIKTVKKYNTNLATKIENDN